MRLLEEETLKFWDRLMVRSKVTIDGVSREFPLQFSEIEGKILRKFVYIDDVMGTITKAVLIDNQGREYLPKAVNVKKNDVGQMIAFVIEVDIQVKEDVHG